MIKEAINKLLYAVFPRRCELCGEVCELDAVQCEECRELERISGMLCKICGKPKDICTCKEEKTKLPEYKAFIAPYYYENNIKAGVIRFKEYGFPELAKAMGREISKQIDDYYGDIQFDCITYVPMTKKKVKKRGYNQAELLANELSACTCIPVEALIEKISDTPDQKKGNAKKRAMNLHGALDLAENTDVYDKTILLIDDIKTTGATLNECAYVLNAYGAKAVYAATFCMTKRKKNGK